MITKIYCSECEHSLDVTKCGHPDNKLEYTDYYGEKVLHNYFPSYKLNKDNDCKWFWRKEPKRTLKQKILYVFKKCFYWFNPLD